MIDKVLLFFENMAERIGVIIRIPRPGAGFMVMSQVLNIIMGTVLLLSGVLTGRRGLRIFGLLELAGALLLRRENRRAGSHGR